MLLDGGWVGILWEKSDQHKVGVRMIKHTIPAGSIAVIPESKSTVPSVSSPPLSVLNDEFEVAENV